MNTNGPKLPKDPNSKQPSDKNLPGESTPTNPPLSSPNEPTRAYPADPSRNFSSDPSQYAYPQKPAPDEPSKVYTTEPLDTARITTEDRRSSDSYARESQKAYQEKVEDKTRENFRNQRDPKKVENFYDYATSNKEQTVTYILLVLGLLFLLFFNNLLGGLIIGMVAGYYFAAEIVYYIRNMGQIVGGHDHLRYVVLTALLLGLFIAAPGIFIGAAIVAAFKQVLAGPPNSTNRPENR